ncbi:MAG: hypothetical protein IID33_07830, partial [Planctomycetes bacterium]|nr:hypothetical protein [Planctomycetota bacterium]
MLVLSIAVEGSTPANSALTAVPTYNGIDFTLAIENVTGTSFGLRTLLYYMLEPDLPAAGSYVVSIAAGAADNIVGGAVSVTGAGQQGPEVTGASDDSQTGASVIQTTITTLSNGTWLFDCVGSGNAVSGFTPDAGQTGRWDQVAASSRGAGSTKEAATAGAVTLGWTAQSGSNRISHVVAAFAPTKIYDFDTGAGVDRFAYGTIIPNTPIPPAVNSIPSTEFSGADYTAIAISDDARHTTGITPGGGSQDRAAVRFVFTLTEPASSINKLDVQWEGGAAVSSGGNDQLQLWIWNAVTSSYTLVAGTGLSPPPPDTVLFG